jgi:hypothetical protein
VGHHSLRTVVVLAASSALAVATISPGAAQETPVPGVGSSSGSTTLLDLRLGTDALGLRLLGEDSETTNDPAASGPSAVERVTPLQITSTLVPALSGASQPTLETRSTSGEDAKATPGLDLASLVGPLPVPGLLGGTIDPVSLRSAVDANGAVSGATGAVRDLSVLGGLLSTGTASADLGSGALITDANALRGLELDRLEVLDLTALLDALGISLADIPLDVAVGLLDGLGLPLPGGFTDPTALLTEIDGLLADSGPVRAQVTTLQGQVDTLQAQLTTAEGQVTSVTSQLGAQQALLAACTVPALCAPIQALVNSLTAQLSSAQALVATLNSQIDALQTQIDDLLDTIAALLDDLLGLLDGVLDGLEGASLLTVEDLAVGVTARADDTLESSVAAVVASVGDVSIGSRSLGGLDAGSALGQVTALADQITGTVGGLLAGIDPALADLVHVELLDQTTSVTEADGVTEALAAVTALRASITPPDLCAVLGRLTGGNDTLGALLGGLGAPLPSLPGPVADVLGDLGSTISCAGSVGVASALTQPVTVEALSLTGAGSFAVPATPGAPGAPTPGSPAPGSPTLPRTGGDAPLALLALALGAAGFGVRRLLVRSA